LVYVGALAILQAERPDPGADIKSFGQAVWWAITTVTTVGYGDLSPVTTTGRVIAAPLMVGGISLVGVVTATLASWLVQRVAAEDTASQAATAAHIEELRAEIRLVAEELRGITAAGASRRLDGVSVDGER
jgi:voltage-gated potassium channel